MLLLSTLIYSLACVECKDYKYNWLKYIAVAFLPLTVFYIIVILFRISAASGALNGYVLMCQLITTPVYVRLFSRFGSTLQLGFHSAWLGVWNLDFFRGIYPPFCLHPKLSMLQILMLDYVIGLYPLTSGKNFIKITSVGMGAAKSNETR